MTDMVQHAPMDSVRWRFHTMVKGHPWEFKWSGYELIKTERVDSYKTKQNLGAKV
jgi:hypothetical protein